MPLTVNKRRKVKVCYKRLGLLLLGGITTVIILNGYHTPGLELEERAQRKITFDINEDGVVVVLDIANTGTDSLANYMIKNAILTPPCQCPDGLTKCQCLNKHGQPWLFQAFNTSGYVCGEHADFTTLTNCPIDYWFRTSARDSRTSRRYLLITMIREPLTRYISQWASFVHEDTFFHNEPRLYRNQSVELQKKGLACYLGKKLPALSLQEFLNCSQNGAINLQTRMLANMTFVDSLGLNGKAYQDALLNSAKRTLEMLPFFGLFARPNDSLKLLESKLGFQFKQPFLLEDPAVEGLFPLPASQQHQILQANNLDLKLYQHARLIFQERLKAVRLPVQSSGNTGTRSLGDNYKIIYRPDLQDRVEDESPPDIPFDGSLDDNAAVGEKYIHTDNDVDTGKKDKQDTKQSVFIQNGTHLKTSEDNENFNDIKIKVQNRKDRSVIEGRTNNRPGFSGNKVKIEHESPDYDPDAEDVFVFLDRLKQIKRQQREQDLIQSKRFSLQQKPVLQTQQPSPLLRETRYHIEQKSPFRLQNQLMQRQEQSKPGVASSDIEQNKAKMISKVLQAQKFPKSENPPNSGPALPQWDMKLDQPYVLTDLEDAMTLKRGKNHPDKGVNKMFI